ncbi:MULTISPECIES: hypothetical protein [Ensifer]|uniref:hypothetical protein n=1 Tax=Ensifer TaxID=106591 RepID=UPI001AEE2C9D|nr:MULTISPECIES: hypothetical protein [Ensifer]
MMLRQERLDNSPATPLRPSLDLETVLVEKIWKREVLEFGTGAVIDFDSPWVECPYLAHLWI